MCTEQKVIVEVLEREGRGRSPRTSITVTHVSLLVEASMKSEDRKVGLEGVLVEQDGEVRVASVRNELVSGVRNVVTGFLQDDCMKSSESGGCDLCGIPARWSWILSQNAEAELMMHEVTVRIVIVAKSSRFGRSETGHWQDYKPRLRERATSSTWVCTDGRVGSRSGGTCTSFVGS